MLERVRLERTGRLTFEAYFEDGLLTRFRGVLAGESVDGVLQTMDAECVTRVFTTDTVTLRREASPAPSAGGPTFRALVARLTASGAYRR